MPTVIRMGQTRGYNDSMRDPDTDELRDPAAREHVDSPYVEMIVPDDVSLADLIVSVTNPAQGIWVSHGPDEYPEWVASDDPTIAAILAAHYAKQAGRQIPVVDLEEVTE